MDNLIGALTVYGGRSENVAVRWTGQLTPEHSEPYTFHYKGDNGIRLWVDGELILDHWVNDWDIEYTSTPVALTAGEPADLKVEYFQNVGGANIHLDWSSPSTARVPVPAAAFSLPPDFQVVGGSAAVDAAGTTVSVVLDDPITGLGADPTHALILQANAGRADIESVTVDPADPHRLTVTVVNPITRGSTVRIGYDGDGDLTTSGGAPLGFFSFTAQNNSTFFMSTPWAADVDADNVLGDYPRPQLTRPTWQNLNGTWQFQPTTANAAVPFGHNLSDTILVPFGMESELSGEHEHHDWSVYRRTFTVPAKWKIGSTDRLILNFGAVDQESWVYVNGKQVAHSINGYASFSADVTDALRRKGAQELLVRVKDLTDATAAAVGKQSANPSGIFYTPTSGIWQTVWMEPVPEQQNISSLSITPDMPNKLVKVRINSSSKTGSALITVKTGRTLVAQVYGRTNIDVTVRLGRDVHPWSPDDPFLYDVTVSYGRDKVGSYFGLRAIGLAEVGGYNRVVLNGKTTFLLSTLDQGFWPDGVYTAPTDEALHWDLARTKELGFNAIRKHIKVEPDRWYYWADKLGLLVMQDMPSGDHPDQAAKDRFVTAAHDEIVQLYNHPSIVAWVPFNEGWGEWDRTATGLIADQVKAWDPTRLVDAHSGVNCCNSHGDSGRGDLIDWHMYTGPGFPSPDATRAAMDGEHGGYSLTIPGHAWSGASANPYGEVADSAALTAAYVANTAKLEPAASCNLSASVYTQITDVETEMNGFWTYDRRVLKMDPAQVRAANLDVLAAAERSGGVGIASGTPGLEGVGWWPLDDSAADASGNGHDAAAPNGVTWIDGPAGAGAAQLNGTDQYLDAGAPILDTTGNYSVAAWVRLDSKAGFGTAVSIDGAATSAFFLQYSDADRRFAFSFGGARALANTIGEPETGRWYHLVGTYDHTDNSLRVYVDGRQAGSIRACGLDVPSGNLVIGRAKWQGNPVDYWKGAVSGVHAYDRALTSADVETLASAEPSH